MPDIICLLYTSTFKECTHPSGYQYYWLAGDLINEWKDEDDFDTSEVFRGYVVITPIKSDITDYAQMEPMEKLIKEMKLGGKNAE